MKTVLPQFGGRYLHTVQVQTVVIQTRRVVPIVLFAGALAYAQTTIPKTVPETDPRIAPILELLMHPTSARVEASMIKVAMGQYTHCETKGTSTDCAPQTKFFNEHRVVLEFDFNGERVKVVGGCSPSESRHCAMLLELGESASLSCKDVSKDVYMCTTTGQKTFVLEKKKWENVHQYFIYPVEGGKPNHRYYIPLAFINGLNVSAD